LGGARLKRNVLFQVVTSRLGTISNTFGLPQNLFQESFSRQAAVTWPVPRGQKMAHLSLIGGNHARRIFGFWQEKIGWLYLKNFGLIRLFQ
jgi:hypothetical protein